MASFRGIEGSASYAATAIANLKSWAFTSTMGVIDVTVKGDKHQNVKGGVVTGTATLTCVLDAVTGQLALISLLATATPAGTPGALVLTVDTGKTYTVQALYTGHTITSPDGDNPCTVDFNFTLSGAVTEAWA